jgi:hypothetical protein
MNNINKFTKYFLVFLNLVFALNINLAKADNLDKFNELKNNFNICNKEFDTGIKSCDEKWSTKCYNVLTNVNKNTQKCYINVAKELFLLYYNQDNIKTQKMFDEIRSFTYNKYLFIYQENNYCQKNNCGISPYLHSEYATTYAIKNYIDKTFLAIENHLR